MNEPNGKSRINLRCTLGLHSWGNRHSGDPFRCSRCLAWHLRHPDREDLLSSLCASSEFNLANIKRLLDKYPELVRSQNEESGNTPLHFSIWNWRCDKTAIVELLIARGADIEAKTRGQTIETQPASYNYLGEPASTKYVPGGRTPLHEAVGTNYFHVGWPNINAAKILLAHKANVNATDEKGYTPLALTLSNALWEQYERREDSYRKLLELAEILLANGADPNCGGPALTRITGYEKVLNSEMFGLLTRFGANRERL